MSPASPPRSLAQIQAFLHEQIPLVRAMGVRVESYENGELLLCAPLLLNHNHLGTAFGGSLSALATLAGYGLLWLELRDPTAHVVIAESTLKFRRPVRGALRALCCQPKASALSAFQDEFARRGKARLSLRVEIREQETIAVEFTGSFVALRARA